MPAIDAKAAPHCDLALEAAVRSLTDQTARQAGAVGRMTQEYEALQDMHNAYRRQMETLTTDLAGRLEQSLETVTEALLANEEMAERSRYWESRAAHAESRLAPRERLYVVRPEGA